MIFELKCSVFISWLWYNWEGLSHGSAIICSLDARFLVLPDAFEFIIVIIYFCSEVIQDLDKSLINTSGWLSVEFRIHYVFLYF